MVVLVDLEQPFPAGVQPQFGMAGVRALADTTAVLAVPGAGTVLASAEVGARALVPMVLAAVAGTGDFSFSRVFALFALLKTRVRPVAAV